jgi:hypothetical protein
MNKRHVIWLLVGLSLVLVGPACVGEVAPEAGQPDFGGEPSISGTLSEQAAPNGGATVTYKTCSDMYFTCQEIGGFCTKKYPGCNTWGQSACGTCYENCQAGARYPKECKCSSCGFTE